MISNKIETAVTSMKVNAYTVRFLKFLIYCFYFHYVSPSVMLNSTFVQSHLLFMFIDM